MRMLDMYGAVNPVWLSFMPAGRIPPTCTLWARTSDSVLTDEDYSIVALRMVDGVVVEQMQVNEGVNYNLPNFVGYERDTLALWTEYDSTGFPVETYNEIAIVS